MGINENEALVLARKIAMFNSESIYYVKNSLLLITATIQSSLDDNKEKFRIIIKSNYPSIDTSLIIANTNNNHNHDLTKLDIDLIQQMLIEHLPSSTTTNSNNSDKNNSSSYELNNTTNIKPLN